MAQSNDTNNPNPPRDEAGDPGPTQGPAQGRDRAHSHAPDHGHDHAHGRSHDHDHAHDDPFHVHPTDELDTEGFDPAQKSLAEALRISFAILKAVVVLLLIVFIVVGSYRKIENGQVGVRVRFGALQGETVNDQMYAVDWLGRRLGLNGPDARALADRLFVEGGAAEPIAVDAMGGRYRLTSRPLEPGGGRELARWTVRVADERGGEAETATASKVVLPDGAEAVRVGVERFAVNVLEPGPHFGLPEPIDRIIVLPVTPESVTIGPAEFEVYDIDQARVVEAMDTGFWFEQAPSDVGRPLAEIEPRRGGLVPGRDGSLLTSDGAIVHGLFTIEYQIDPERAASFVRHVGAGDIRDSRRRARELVRQIASRAVVHAVAQTTVEQYWRGDIDREAILDRTQAMLDRIDAGLSITKVTVDKPTPPLSVLPSFNRVNDAVTDKQQKIEEARREATETLTETAGRAYEPLAALLEAYLDARRDGEADRADGARRAIDAILDGAAVGRTLETLRGAGVIDEARRVAMIREYGPVTLSGDARQVIERARGERQDIESRVRAEADTFTRYLQRYGEFETDDGTGERRLVGVNPKLRRIIVHRQWQDMLEEVIGGASETFWLPRDPDHLYLELGRNPELRRSREEAARRALNRGAAGDE